MTTQELINVISKLEDQKRFIEYQIQNYRERLVRLQEHNMCSESEQPSKPDREK